MRQHVLKKGFGHPFHLVDLSPWPILLSVLLLSTCLGLVRWLTLGGAVNLIPQLVLIGLLAILWWRDVIRESFQGHHTKLVQRGIKIGFLLFLITEVMLFFSFFWAFFHSSLNPDIALSSKWPPMGVHFINPWSLPFLGSTLLLSSGFVLTLGHHAFLLGDKGVAILGMIVTIIKGACFVGVQYTEYSFSEFTIADSVFGSVFYLTTGLHAIHVIIGVLFLVVATVRMYLDDYTLEHHLSLEFAIFYYHLVDVIWLFVFFTYYYWGS